jgi:hypothetical protein
MTGLHRTPLTTSDKIGLAAKALLSEAYGAVTAPSEEYEVYRAREVATDALETHFETPPRRTVSSMFAWTGPSWSEPC